MVKLNGTNTWILASIHLMTEIAHLSIKKLMANELRQDWKVGHLSERGILGKSQGGRFCPGLKRREMKRNER